MLPLCKWSKNSSSLFVVNNEKKRLIIVSGMYNARKEVLIMVVNRNLLALVFSLMLELFAMLVVAGTAAGPLFVVVGPERRMRFSMMPFFRLGR